MRKIEIDNRVFDIPSGWDDIKLKEFETWYLQTPETSLEQVQYIADICNIDAKELVLFPYQVYNMIVKSIDFIFEREYGVSNKLFIGRKEYFVTSSDKLVLGEWVDIDSVLNSESTNKLSEILSIVCRPVGEKYDPEKSDERKLMFMDLPCSQTLPCIDFFLNRGFELKKIMNLCSTQIEQANLCLKVSETLALDTDGIKQLPIWQRIKYIYLMRSLKKELARFSDFSYIKQTNQ